ncbi:hypothetical protein [Rhodococcus phage REQ1]|uniref:hypothetical protein n=1 Tax=Rhodococcus phage REQ1 TaxID=1109712 RepID=UPI00023EEC71|nr:hypothetical protein RoPhREQ1_gp79 [Rhodococcus phage REQ1]AEV52075.1 hypothetical protein [Rhodococcus phage REQ1]
MALFNFQPSGDWLNDGWKIIGGVTALWQALTDLSDAKYIQCPASKAGAAVSFPVDTTSVPDGAIITSVTVKMRVGLGAGAAPSGTAPSITVAVVAQDNTSRYLTRTIYPTSTPTDYEIATYQRDALGLAWDVQRLNNLLCRIFSYVGIFDLIRCYRLWCEIKYRLRPTVAITAPSGTVTTPSPTISWTYTQTDGDPQKTVEYKLFTAEQVAKVSFNPDTATPVFQDTLQGDLTSVLLPTSINSNNYWVYMRVTSSFGARSVWVGRQFTVSGPSPAIPGVDDPTDALGSAVITVVPDSESGSASLHMRNTSNMLSAQEADAESPTDGHTFSATNATITRESGVSFPGGTSSWKVTATAGGAAQVTTDFIEIEESLPMTSRAQFRAAVTGRSCRVVMRFYDDGYAEIAGSALTGSSVTDSTSTWTEASVYGNAPANAVYTRVTFEVLSAAASEVHNLDHLGVSYGLNTPWSDGSHASRNLLSAYISTAEGTQIGGEFWTPDAASTAVTAAATGTGASGSNCFKMTYNGLSPSIGFRGVGTAFTSPTSGADFTLNKPAGTATGDLMLAFVTTSEFCTITPPAGWTLVNSAKVDDGTTDTAMFVLKRTATASEPASWTDGFLSTNSLRRSAVTVAYSGAADVLTDTQAASGNDTPLGLQTPSLNNTDPNGWRVSAFAVSDNASGGTLTANRQSPFTIPQISFVGSASPWFTANTAGSYTINKPSGTQSGDVMVATIGYLGNGATVNPPAGWTLRNHTTANNTSAGPYSLAVIYRVAGGSEPSSWSGTITGGSLYRTTTTQCLAYRNVDNASPFISSNITGTLNSSALVTGQAANTNALAWRVSAFGGLSEAANSFGSTNEVVERVDNYVQYSILFGSRAGNAVMMADSNGAVSSGTYERYAYSNNSLYAGVGFIGFLRPLGTPPTPVADETARIAAGPVGSANPWVSARVFDSNGVTPTGSQSITGIWTPGSGTDKNSMAGWFGILKPAQAQTVGYATATMNRTVDVSLVKTDQIPDADFVTATASFTGSTAGTPYLTVNFYRANTLLGSQIGEGTAFATGGWTKSSATFRIPSGTTRMSVGVSVSDRNVGDIVYWDRVSLAYGVDATYRPSTSRAEHPVWSMPQIQYADDDGTGYSDWADLPGLKSNPPAFEPRSGTALYTDHAPIPLTNRKYRARTVSLGLGGDLFVSEWGPDSPEFTYEAENYWLKDISNPNNNLRLKVAWDKTQVAKTNSATVFQPLGSDLPVVLSEGYKGDTFTLKLTPVNHEERAELRKMLTSGRTLFLQSDIDDAWWVRPVGDLIEDVLPTYNRQSNPLREITCQFVQVAPAE